jgi:Zn finger protein HypA/HybF involved in hydrogenase expression
MSDKILCDYGCGNIAVHTLKNGRHICSSSWTKCSVNRLKNTAGLKTSYALGKNTPRHFTNEERLRGSLTHVNNKLNGKFETLGKKLRYEVVYREQNKKCLICNIDSWNSKSIRLELDHIDGDRTNNTRLNLRLLCPNCHSQTPTFRGRNINTGQTKIDDETLLHALKSTRNIHSALISVGLAPKGGNYKRAKKLLNMLP